MEQKLRSATFRWRIAGILLMIVQLLLCASLLGMVVFRDAESFGQTGAMGIGADGLGLAVLTFILLSGLRMRTLDGVSAIFMLVVFFGAIYLYLDAMAYLIDGIASIRQLNMAVNTGNYIVGTMMSWLFTKLVRELKHTETVSDRYVATVSDILLAVSILLAIGNMKFKYYFTVSSAGVYARTETYAVSLICPSVILAVCAFYIMLAKFKIKDKLILLCYPMLPYIGALVMLRFSGPSLTCIMMICSVVFIYSNFYVQMKEDVFRNQAELARSNVTALQLQINPHFIYNTLGAIESLIEIDPAQAQQMLLTFSGYLRNNFGELSHKSKVPFMTEMEHIDSYITIEQMRFPDIQVEYDFRVLEFEIPSLSVQPLVENAITHGIMGRETGGTVTISSYEDDRAYYVAVKDDGIGFDTTCKKEDGKNHIGVANVRTRLQVLFGGTLTIKSVPGEGTTAEMRIPKGEI